MKRFLIKWTLISLGVIITSLFLWSSYNSYTRKRFVEEQRIQLLEYTPTRTDWSKNEQSPMIVAYPKPLQSKQTKKQDPSFADQAIKFISEIEYQKGFDSAIEFLGQAKEAVLKFFTDDTDKFYLVPKANNT